MKMDRKIRKISLVFLIKLFYKGWRIAVGLGQ